MSGVDAHPSDAAPRPGDECSTLILPLTNPQRSNTQKSACGLALSRTAQFRWPRRWLLTWDIKGSGVPPILALVTRRLLPPSPPHSFSTLPSIPYDHGLERSTGGGAAGESHRQRLQAGSSPGGIRDNTKYMKKTLKDQNWALRRYEKWVQTEARSRSKA